MADLYGRKWTFAINLLFQVFSLLTMIFAKSYMGLFGALFVLGLCSSGRWTVTYIYVNEFLTERNIKCISPFFNACAGLAYVIGALLL